MRPSRCRWRGWPNLLNDLGRGYDFVIFDTSAASGRLRVAAMRVADLMIVPTRVEALGMADIAGLIEALRQAQGRHLRQAQRQLRNRVMELRRRSRRRC